MATPNKPKPAVKKTFKLTYKQEGSPARHVVQEITNELTFGTLVGLAQEEFGISDDKQRFKMGFPPKPIKMSPDEPLKVSCLMIQFYFTQIFAIPTMDMFHSHSILYNNTIALRAAENTSYSPMASFGRLVYPNQLIPVVYKKSYMRF